MFYQIISQCGDFSYIFPLHKEYNNKYFKTD